MGGWGEWDGDVGCVDPYINKYIHMHESRLLTVLAVGRDLVMKEGRTRRWKPWIQIRSPSLYTSTT